jgi:hypothetical protein
MHELTLTLPDELYDQLQAEAARKGLPLERFIVGQLAMETVPTEQERQEQHVLEEALASTGLVQAVSTDLIAAYVVDPTAPRQSPIRVQGKPLSAVIIEQRDRTQ